MKKLIVLALVAGALATVVNDGARYVATLYRLAEGTQQVATEAARAAHSERGAYQAGGKTAVTAAQERGIVLYGYRSTDDEVEVWTYDGVEGTWVAGPFLAWQGSQPLDTPIQLREYDTAFIR